MNTFQGDLTNTSAEKLHCCTSPVQIPPVFGIDSMHGANYVSDAVMFPHAINLAAAFSPELAHASGRATAQQTRGAGMPWAFAPLFDVAMAPRFPRVYETFGEDPWLVATMVRLSNTRRCAEHRSCWRAGF